MKILNWLVFIGLMFGVFEGGCFGEIGKQAEDAESIIEKWAQNQDKLRSYIIEEEAQSTYTVKASNRAYLAHTLKPFTKFYRNEIKTDGRRYYKSTLNWGERPGVGKVSEYQGSYNIHLYVDDKLYTSASTKHEGLKPGRVTIRNQVSDALKNNVFGELHGHGAFGNFESVPEGRIDRLFKDAKLEVLPATEDINGFACYVVIASTSHGYYKLWFSPQQGYSIVKAIHKQKAGDINNGHPLPKNYRGTEEIEVTKIDDVNGIWIPKEVHYTAGGGQGPGESSKNETVYKITSIKINPDHDSLGSFKIKDFRNGSFVMIDPVVGKIYRPGSHRQYTWQDGNVVDKNGKVIMTVDKELIDDK